MNRQIWIIIVIVFVVMLGIALVAEWMHTQRRDSAVTSPQGPPPSAVPTGRSFAAIRP